MRKLKSLTVMRIAFLSSIVLVLGVFFISETFKVRYYDYQCHYSQMTDQKSKNNTVDFLFIGGSQMMRSLEPEIFNKYFNNEVSSMNFARGRRGIEQSYIMLKDALEHLKIKNVIYLFFPMSFPAGRYHTNLHLTSKVKDYFKVQWFDSSYNTLWFRLSDFAKHIIKRVIYLSTELKARKSDFFNYKKSQLKLKHRTCARVKDSSHVRIEQLYGLIKNFKSSGSNILKTRKIPPFSDSYLQHSVKYLKKMKVEIEKRGANFWVLAYPVHGFGPVYSDNEITRLKKEINTPILYPSKGFYEKLFQAGNYTDRNHFSYKGKILMTRWLAEQLK